MPCSVVLIKGSDTLESYLGAADADDDTGGEAEGKKAAKADRGGGGKEDVWPDEVAV